MKTSIISFLLLTSLSVSLVASENAENQLNATLQLRPRAEYRNGVLSPRTTGEVPAGFINNRTRLNLNYRSQGLSMGLSVQNAGVWGQEPQVSRNANLGVYEAWAQLTTTDGWFMKLGRQTLVYDDERILGALDWNTAGRSHDVLKLGYEDKTHQLHLALAFNQNSEKTIGGTYYQTAQPYKTMQLLWYRYNGSPSFRPSFMLMNLGIENGNSILGKSDLASMQTIGTHIAAKATDQLRINGSAFYQLGKTRSDATISAWMLAVQGNYSVSDQTGLILGSDLLSGEENLNNNTTYNAFNPLYGTHHKFYGAMDYFYASSFRGNLNPGLWDSYVGISHKPSKKLNVSATCHYFAITAEINDGGSPLKKGLGTEIDLQFEYTIRKDVRMSGGYSTLFGTRSMDQVKGGNHNAWQDWGWLSLNINPEILFVKF